MRAFRGDEDARLYEYVRASGRVVVPSRERQAELAARMRAGDDEARDELARTSLPLVISIARKYRGRGLEPEDLVQEGFLGLLRALETWDPAIGMLSTYATWWIRQSVARAIDDRGSTIRTPAHLAFLIRSRERREIDLEQAGVDDPIVRAAALLDSDPPWSRTTHYDEALRASREIRSIEVSRSVGDDDGIALREDPNAPDPVEESATLEAEEAARALVSQLPEREESVIVLRFGLYGESARTLEEVGEVLGVSRERVRQIEMRAMRALRSLSAGEGLPTSRSEKAALARVPCECGCGETIVPRKTRSIRRRYASRACYARVLRSGAAPWAHPFQEVVGSRECACGCGATFPIVRRRGKARAYATAACYQRAYYERVGRHRDRRRPKA